MKDREFSRTFKELHMTAESTLRTANPILYLNVKNPSGQFDVLVLMSAYHYALIICTDLIDEGDDFDYVNIRTKIVAPILSYMSHYVQAYKEIVRLDGMSFTEFHAHRVFDFAVLDDSDITIMSSLGESTGTLIQDPSYIFVAPEHVSLDEFVFTPNHMN